MDVDPNSSKNYSDSEIPTSTDDFGDDLRKYSPGVRNIDLKGRIIRGVAALLFFVFVIVYNERWPTVLDHPVLFTLGLILLAFLTALTFIQSFLSFCVIDGLLGRTNISGHFQRVTPEAHLLDRKRAFWITAGALILGILFAAILLIKEVGSTV